MIEQTGSNTTKEFSNKQERNFEVSIDINVLKKLFKRFVMFPAEAKQSDMNAVAYGMYSPLHIRLVLFKTFCGRERWPTKSFAQRSVLTTQPPCSQNQTFTNSAFRPRNVGLFITPASFSEEGYIKRQ
jgi:hypothetical protein